MECKSQKSTPKLTMKLVIQFIQSPARFKRFLNGFSIEQLAVFNQLMIEQIETKQQEIEKNKKQEAVREQKRLEIIERIKEHGFNANDLFKKRQKKSAVMVEHGHKYESNINN